LIYVGDQEGPLQVSGSIVGQRELREIVYSTLVLNENSRTRGTVQRNVASRTRHIRDCRDPLVYGPVRIPLDNTQKDDRKLRQVRLF